MAQYSNLKAYIEEKIYENGTQAITGDILQDVLKVMTDDLGEFYQMGGVASPSTDPGTPDAKVIYFATEAGTYTNFGDITLEAGEVALLIFETSWTKETLNVLSAANGGVKTANLADGAVTTEKIAGGAVETAKIANNAVTSGKVADGAIGTAKIADGAIDADKIAANAVESAKIKNGAVTEGKINDGAVTAGKVAANAVTTAKIADEAVTTAKLNDGAVTEDKIATDAVTSGKVKDGAIGTAKIAAGAVTHAKIGVGAVEESNIKDGAVTSDKIANGAVGSDQLAEGAFSAENLADGSVTTDKLADDAVTAEKIADGAVTADKFANGSVTTIKLGSGAVTTEKIGDGMVTRQKLADSSVGTSKIIDGAVTTAKVADANVTTAKIADANVTTGKLADGAVTTAKIADGNVTGAKLQEGVRPVINVNALNEQTSAYGSAALARAAVPSALRILGLHIIYLLAGGWFEDEYVGSDVSGWGTASNWRAVGPVSVSQNTNTKGHQIFIGGVKTGNIDDFFNVNSYNNKSDAYISAAAARAAVPATAMALGITITYLLADGWYVEQFIGFSIDGWSNSDNWKVINVKGYTDSMLVNSVLNTLIIDTTGYNGNFDKSKLQLKNLCRNYTIDSYQYWGFGLQYNNGHFGEVYFHSELSSFETTIQGVKIYAQFNWDNLSSGSYIGAVFNLHKVCFSILTPEHLEQIDTNITNLQTDVADISSEIQSNEKQQGIIFKNNGYFINKNNGEIVSISGYGVTDVINLIKGQKVEYQLSGGSSAALIAIYDLSDNYIYSKSVIGQGESTLTTGTFTATEDCKIRICSVNLSSRYYIIKQFSNLLLEKLRWSGKKWACVGDSLTEYNNRTDKHYFDYVADKTGINILNYGVSGTGYANGSSAGNKEFYKRILNIDSAADVVTIFGSFNDMETNMPLGTITDTGTDTICGCINKTIDNLYSVIPTVNLGVVTPTPWDNRRPTAAGDSANENYVNAIINICRLRSIPCLDLFHCSNLRPWDATFRILAYSKDGGGGVHPDETGHKLIAGRFFELLSSLIVD